MADYYTQFSVVVPTPVGGEEETIKWVEGWTFIRDCLFQEENLDLLDAEFNVNVEYLKHEGLWVYSDGEGSVESAVATIQQYLLDFDISEGIVLSWALTCSKLRTDGFEGGAVLITADTEKWVNPQTVLSEEARVKGLKLLDY